MKDTKVLTWNKTLPTQVGWYWMRWPMNKENPQIFEIRDYAGELAIGNSTLKGWQSLENCEWAGPIDLPVESSTDHKGNVDDFLAQVDEIDGRYTGRTDPPISRKLASKLLTASCKGFLGLTE